MGQAAAILLLSWFIAAGVGHAADSATKARLVLSADVARPGETVWAGIRLTMAPGWHVYWRNPGESGSPTSVEWILPQGVTAGAIQWPPPESLSASDLTTFVYHTETMLLVPLTLSANLPTGSVDLKAKVAWLECEVACVPGDTTVSAKLTIGGSPSHPPPRPRLSRGSAGFPR